jgi:hypothetical protein
VSIDALAVETHDWSDGSPTYSFEVVMTTGPRLNIGSSWSRAEIEEVKKRVASFLGLAA